MSDELDKFVLKYEVQMSDAIERLEKLHEKTKKIEEDSGKAGKSLKTFASGASDELGKMLPMVNMISTAVKTMGAEFAVAGLAIGVVAGAVNAAMTARTQYNAQRTQGRDSGVSGVRMEDLQRKLVGGNVTRDSVAEGLKGQSDLMRDAQSDISGMNDANIKLRMMGFKVRSANGRPLSQMDLLKQQGAKWAGMSDANVMADAKMLGMNPDLALSIKKQGRDIGRSGLSKEEIENYDKGSKATQKLNDDLAKFNEQMHELSVTLGTEVLPKFGIWIDKLGSGAKELNDGLKMTAADKKRQQDIETQIKGDNAKAHGWSWSDGKSDADYDADVSRQAIAKMKEQDVKAAKDKADAEAKKNTKSKDSTTDLLEAKDQQNEDFQQTTTDFQTAVNMFAASVQSMSGALSQQEIMLNLFRGTGGTLTSQAGAAGGTSGQSTGSVSNLASRGKYGALYSQVEKELGLKPGSLSSIASVENQPQDPSLKSAKGATGLMQVMPANFKSLGITDATDPLQNIRGGGKLYAQYLKMYNGDERQALAAYNIGLNQQKQKLPRVQEYATDVLSKRPGSQAVAAGEHPLNAQERLMVAQDRSKLLGKPVTQIVNQGDSQGDLDRIKSYQLRQAQNAQTIAQAKLEGLTHAPEGSLIPNGAIARASMEAKAASAQVTRLTQSQDQGLYARPGAATDLTKNVPQQMIINAPITIQGSHDAEATGKAVAAHLNGEVANVVNQNTTNVVR